MGRGPHLKTRPDMVGALNPRWARDGRVSVGQRFGSWMVLSDAPFEKSGALYVRARCVCGIERDANLRFIEIGRSIQCKGCATRQRHRRNGELIIQSRVDKVLQKRVNDWFQRCNNPKSRSWRNYGARGIECRFGSVREGVEWVKINLPHPTYLELDIDRRDNDGHYEPGNLRLVTRKVNLANRSRRATISSTAAHAHGSPLKQA